MTYLSKDEIHNRLSQIPRYMDDDNDGLIPIRDVRRVIDQIRGVDIVHCKHCKKCETLDDGVSFECMDTEMVYYAPTYDVETYFCADGERRDSE